MLILCLENVILVFHICYLLQCDPAGRPEEDQQLLFINPDVAVEQIGDDPILILENDM